MFDQSDLDISTVAISDQPSDLRTLPLLALSLEYRGMLPTPGDPKDRPYHPTLYEVTQWTVRGCSGLNTKDYPIWKNSLGTSSRRLGWSKRAI